MFVWIPSRGDKLLELDPSNKVLVLRGHYPVVSRHEEDLVVTLRTSRLLFHISGFLVLRQLSQMRGVYRVLPLDMGKGALLPVSRMGWVSRLLANMGGLMGSSSA